MAVDTRNRRASCLNLDGWSRVYPNPDGSLASQADRQHVAGKYPGIAAAPPGGVTVVAQLSAFFRMMTGGTWRRVN